MRIDAPLALGLALVTSARLLTGCAWLTAHEAQLERLGCDLAQLADTEPGIAAFACALPGETRPAPEHEAAVRAELRATTAAPARPRARMIHGHGLILDQRAVRMDAPIVDAGAEGGPR